MSILRQRFFLIAAFLFATAQRLPAPIQELPESPTPAPEEEANSKTSHKTKKTEEEAPKEERRSSAGTAKSQPTPRSPQFAGAWTGTIAQGIWGNVECTFIANAAGTSVIEKSRLGTDTQPSKWDGHALTWRSGVFMKEINWMLTPNSDGTTAAVNCKSPFYGNPSAVFKRGETANAKPSATVVASSPTPAKSNEAQPPTAKPVPGKPGFVYDPFNPNSKMLLDVRGKASGTKVRDPSGRLFIVP